MREICLIIHNVRSCHNVGSLLRTAEGMGVASVFMTGYTPYPKLKNDPRLPHLATKIDHRIHKTALGAESLLHWEYIQDIKVALRRLKKDGFELVAIEQDGKSQDLTSFKFPNKVALVVGNEVEGIEESILSQVDKIVEIPMFGKKESYNVAQAAAMALYQIRFIEV